MKIQTDINSINREQFRVQEHFVAGKKCFLVTPNDFKVKWTQENKHLRSVVLNENGEILSSGFPKFTNWGENPEHFPVPIDLGGCFIIEKLDGSLLSWTKVDGELIVRTRGTMDARKLKNGAEIDFFLQKYPKLLDHNNNETWDYSIITEWTSPTNVIVLAYGSEPKLYLTGVVYHCNGVLEEQTWLDILSERLSIPRPLRFAFDSVAGMQDTVSKLQDKEGVVVYSNSGQTLHKLKADKYLILHRMRSELSSLPKVLDAYLNFDDNDGKLSFSKYIEQTFDYEIFKKAEENIKVIEAVAIVVARYILDLLWFVNDNKDLPQKEFALLAIKEYKKSASILFDFRKGTGLLMNHQRKLFEEMLNT